MYLLNEYMTTQSAVRILLLSKFSDHRFKISQQRPALSFGGSRLKEIFVLLLKQVLLWEWAVYSQSHQGKLCGHCQLLRITDHKTLEVNISWK